MQVKVDERESRVILPEVVDRTNVNELDNALQSLYDKGSSTIKIDCGNLEMLDSAGLGSFVLYEKRLKERGGGLKVINVDSAYIKHLFNAIELNRVIEIE